MRYMLIAAVAAPMVLVQGAAWAQASASVPSASGANVGVSAGDMPSAMPDLIRRYNTDSNYISRFSRVGWSNERWEKLEAFNKEWLERLDGLEYERLGVADRIDWHLLRSKVQWELSDLAMERHRLEEMDAVLPFRKQVQALELARVQLEKCDPEAAAAVLSEVAARAKKVREQVQAGKKGKKGGEKADGGEEEKKDEGEPIVLAPAVAQRASGAVNGLVGVIDDWSEYYEEFVPEFGWWTRRPREEAQKELRELAKYLREEVAGIKGKDEDPLVGDPIGREALMADLRGEMLAYTPEELITIGERELAWCEAEMQKAAAEMGYADDWKKALAKVKDAHVPAGEQATLVRDESKAVIKFVKDHDLITVPKMCEESWRLEMHSPATQRTLPYAVYGGQYMGVSYAAGSMAHDEKLMSMRGNNRHFTHIVAPHELIPGHHLQGYYAAREREYRRQFSTPFLVEGWALYWEFRFWDLGWAGATGHDAAMDRVGMLFWRMHRAARIIVSLKFHLGEMTPKEMVDFLVDRVGHERSGATAEVRRYIGGNYSPLYQCGYMIGGIQLRELRKELVESGKMGDKQFNNAVMMENSVPIEMIRASLKGESLAKDWKPSWRFAETP